MGADKILFCTYLKVDSFTSIPAGRFREAKQALERKKAIEMTGTHEAGTLSRRRRHGIAIESCEKDGFDTWRVKGAGSNSEMPTA